MNRNSKILVVLITAVLITSGCVDDEENESNTSPISINDFSITPDPAPGDQTVNVQMEAENTGDNDAENVYATIFGPTFASGEDEQRTWRDDSGGEVSSELRTMELNDLSAGSDTSPAVPGRDTITLRSPSIDEGRIVPYTFNARLQYEYQTTGSTSIEVMSDDRYEDSDTSQRRPDTETSDGPIQLEVQGTTPHIFYDDGDAEDELCITLTNQGSGDPFLVSTDSSASHGDSGYDIDEESEDKVELQIEDVGNVQFSPQGSDEETIIVDMVGDQGFQCFDMELEGLGTVTDLEQTTDIPIEVKYGYEEETSTSVTVEGRRN